MRLWELCAAAGLACSCGDREITGICSDSRRAKAGDLYVCINGLHTDGHAYAAAAVQSGAVCVLAERVEGLSELAVPILLCKDTREALAYLWHAWYGFPARRLKLIGVTGTNGKTTVTHMLRGILEGALHRCGLIGTVGVEAMGKVLPCAADDALANMTTPDPEQLYRVLRDMADMGVEYVVMEVSSHALALKKVAPLHFKAAVFTNLTSEHLDFHGTMDAYADAKATLFKQAELCVLNSDSPYAPLMRARAMGTCVDCGTAGDYLADDVVSLGTRGVRYRLCGENCRMQISCPIPGDFTVINSLQAAVCAMKLGCSPAVVKTALATMKPVKGRMERVRLGVGAEFTVLIDYAHTPDALEKLLYSVRPMVEKGGRLTLLFGCGGDRDKGKRPIMGEIASRLADVVILTSDNSRSEEPTEILKQIREGIRKKDALYVIPDREAAIRFAVTSAQKGDLILLAGKGHEEYEITSAGRRRFSEKEIVQDAFQALTRKKTEPTI